MRYLALAILVMLGPLSTALAQHAGTPQEQQACSRDASRFCRSELGNDMAVRQCLQVIHLRHWALAHLAPFSAEPRTHVLGTVPRLYPNVSGLVSFRQTSEV